MANNYAFNFEVVYLMVRSTNPFINTLEIRGLKAQDDSISITLPESYASLQTGAYSGEGGWILNTNRSGEVKITFGTFSDICNKFFQWGETMDPRKYTSAFNSDTQMTLASPTSGEKFIFKNCFLKSTPGTINFGTNETEQTRSFSIGFIDYHYSKIPRT